MCWHCFERVFICQQCFVVYILDICTYVIFEKLNVATILISSRSQSETRWDFYFKRKDQSRKTTATATTVGIIAAKCHQWRPFQQFLIVWLAFCGFTVWFVCCTCSIHFSRTLMITRNGLRGIVLSSRLFGCVILVL